MSANTTQVDLINLIHRHLEENGYHSAASELRKHAPQAKNNSSTTLIDVYSSWLSKSKKKPRESKPSKSKNGLTPSKALTNQVSLDDGDDEMSQSLLPQTPLASNKKSLASTPIKSGLASPRKTLAATPISAAADNVSDTTNISGDEAKAQSKTPQKDVISSPAATAPSDAKTISPKKKQSAAVKADSTKKKAAPVKRRIKDGKVKQKSTEAKKAKKEKRPAPVGGGDSDSDSSLDVEKWRGLLLNMSDTDLARMDAINAMDATPKRPAVKRVRKPRAKPAPKTNPQSGPDSSITQTEHKESKATEKQKKTAKAQLSSAPLQNQVNTEPTQKRASDEERTEDQASGNEPPGEVTALKKKRKRKDKVSEGETKDEGAAGDCEKTGETNGVTAESQSGHDNEVPALTASKKKSKKKKTEKESLSDSVREEKEGENNDGELEVLTQVVVKKKKKKKKQSIDESGQLPPEENQAANEENEKEVTVKAKKKSKTLYSGHSESTLDETVVEANAHETTAELSEQTPGKKKKKRKSSKEDVETEPQTPSETPGPPSEKKKKSKVKAAEEPL